MIKFIKFILISVIMLFLLAAGCLYYAFRIEPFMLKVHEYSLNEADKGADVVRIVQFSDTHIKEDFTGENLTKVVAAINKQKPDIVVFTGDLYDNYAVYRDNDNIVAQLQNIEAKYGKIAIWGNRDYGGGAVRQYETVLERAGFTVLKNENLYVSVEHDKKILFTGLDDSLLGHANLPDIANEDEAEYQILLSHEPDVIEDYQGNHYDLTLSGHSHGGQVNIPFLPEVNQRAVSSTLFSSKYTGGMYSLESGKKMYVNTGIGTTHISARFGVVPEIAIFKVHL